MAWFSLAKVAIQAGSHILRKDKNKNDDGRCTASYAIKMAKGDIEYQGKIIRNKTIGLERRVRFDPSYSDDYAVYGVFSDDPTVY